MKNSEEVRKVVKKISKLIERNNALTERYNAMSPEGREEVDKALREAGFPGWFQERAIPSLPKKK